MTGMRPFAGQDLATQQSNGTDPQERAPAGIAVVIPAWQPDHRLLALVRSLQGFAFQRIFIVDDGSAADRQPLFEELLASAPGLTVYRHPKNRGKGQALKSAFRLVLSGPGITGVVTADGDGQHLPVDILRVAHAIALAPARAVLGVRRFTGQVPVRSRLGNATARFLFTLLTGYTVQDTQTGLRGLPVTLLPELLTLPGDRYEYETVMLAHLCRTSGLPHQIPIQTVYLDNNRGSHFNPLWDSLRVYRALLRSVMPFHRRLRPAPAVPAETPFRTT